MAIIGIWSGSYLYDHPECVISIDYQSAYIYERERICGSVIGAMLISILALPLIPLAWCAGSYGLKILRSLVSFYIRWL